MKHQWQVWSKDELRRWVVVDEGAEEHCRKAEARRNVALLKYGLEGEYVALPSGSVPS
jgi:hypothetical protein